MKTGNSKKSALVIASFLFMAIIVFTIQSCIKDNFKLDKLAKTEWNPNIAVPLVYSSLTVQDILTKEDHQGLIVVGNDNFCTLVYKGNLFSLKGDSLVQLPILPQLSSYPTPPLSAGQINTLSTGTLVATYSSTVTFISGANNPLIDSILFKTGNMNISMSSFFKFSGQIVIKIPAAKKNGIAFSKILPFTYSTTVPVNATANCDLTGYTFDMTIGGTTSNQFIVDYDVTIFGPGTVSGTEQMTINQSLNNLKFDKIFGDIGHLSLSPNKDTVEIAIFKRALGTGTFTLVNPSVKVVISNSLGVPIDATFSQLDGYNPPASTYPINGYPSPLPIYSPNFSQIGQTLIGSFTLDNTNSNIVQVINNTPKDVIYKINSWSNPLGATHANFVIDTSRFKVDMEIDLPLYGTAKDFVLMDTVPINLDQTVSDNVESALFRIYNLNGFPLDINMQAYFTDTLYNKLDSLVIPNQVIIPSAVVSSTTGMVVASTQKTYDAVVNKARFANLKTAKHVLLKAVAATTNGGNTNVKIYSTYRLDVKLGVQVQIKSKI